MNRSTTISIVIVVVQLITIALLVISFVTVPLFKFTSNKKSSTSNLLSLASFNNVQYGVFGYCLSSEKDCSSVSVNYKAYEIQASNSDSDNWNMGESTRKGVSQLLLAVPISAGVVFINFLINTVNLITQKRDINENERFIFVQFIISAIFASLSFAGCTISCVSVFLLFYPHVNWPGWILIPAAILALVTIPLSFFQYLFKKNEIYNSESGAIVNEKSSDFYNNNNRLLSDDVVYDDQANSYYDEVDMTDDAKTKNFFTQLQTLGSDNNNSSSDLERKSNAIEGENSEFNKPSQLIDVMKNGSNLTLGTSSNQSEAKGSSSMTNKKDSYNLYQEYKQNEYEIMNEKNGNNVPFKYDSANLNTGNFRDTSGSSSRYTSNNTFKQPGTVERNNTFRTNDFKPESILLLDRKSPLENFQDIKNKQQKNIKEEYEGEVEQYSDISDSDKDFVRNNIIPHSERPILESDDGLHDDQGSNFTSVSQRAGNPEYLKKKMSAPMPAVNNGFVQQQQASGQYQNSQQPLYQGNYPSAMPSQNQYQYQNRSGPMGGFAGQPPTQGMPQPFSQNYNANFDRAGIQHQAMNPQQRQRAPMIFQNNKNFEIPTGSSYQQQFSQNVPVGGARFQPQVYKPSYKKRPMNGNAQMGPSGYNNQYTGSSQQPYSGFR
ncbi:hypothetical protein QEN19_003247 [Hanseniaspora menglaensis]